MDKMSAVLSQRLKKATVPSKMNAMAEQSAKGNLTSFSGVFNISELSEMEKANIATILENYGQEGERSETDLKALFAITSEVKAINNQAALLHGERIKKAQAILLRYREGAFTAWLMAAYGNRQTPYNLLQYYEFYEASPKPLRFQIELMPRQAIYTLASRDGALDRKLAIVEKYRGETKAELLRLIREAFPLHERDKRKSNRGEMLLFSLKKLLFEAKALKGSLSRSHKEAIREIGRQLNQI